MGMKLGVDIKKIIDFRQKLHKFPEISGHEQKTTDLIKHFVSHFRPVRVYEFPNYSIAFEFGSGQTGKTIMFRADIDALPIDETMDLPYRSVNKGWSHKCGHDGHSAILVGLAEALSRQKIKDRVILLFQAAEETLTGALDVISDKQFEQIAPDVIIGFHNIPGYDYNSILVRKGEFNAYVSGIKVVFKGRSIHAAYSRSNSNFILALEKILALIRDTFYHTDLAKRGDLNLTYLNYGKPTFGISPDELVLHIVPRAYQVQDLEEIMDFVEKEMRAVARTHELSIDFIYTEDAPAIYNDPGLVDKLVETVEQEQGRVVFLEEPFSWGEDFGFYTVRYKGVYFGIGSGKERPQLHSKDYDFPDEIILPSIEFLFKFYLKLSQN